MTLKKYLKKNIKTCLIFDFDWTLFKLILPWDHWFDKIKTRLLRIDKKLFSDFLSGKITGAKLEHEYIRRYGKELKRLFDKNAIDFEISFLKGEEENKKFTDFIRMNSKYKLYIWSSNSGDALSLVLKKYGLENKFEKVISRLDVDFIKPEPDGFYKIYDFKTPKSDYLMIGDSSHDEGAAKKAEIDFFKSTYFSSDW